MASGVLRLSDVVVPAVFSPMVVRQSIEKTALISSGAAVNDPFLDNFLTGAGLSINMPRQNPVDTTDAENVSSDDPTVFSTPNKPAQTTEIAVRLSRNNSWSEMDLVRALLGADPLAALVDTLATYWAVRRQKAIIAQLTGILADNAANDSGDMIVDLSVDGGGSANTFSAGTTNFHGSAFIDAFVTMGDAMGGIALALMHSVVYATALKNDLITFERPSQEGEAIPFYMGKQVAVDDSMPSPSAGVFETWLFGRGAIGYGTGAPAVPTEVLRVPGAGNGGGQEIMWDRVEWAHHVAGTSYVGTPASGGPSNAATTNNLAAAASWDRKALNRKYVPVAVLRTREF